MRILVERLSSDNKVFFFLDVTPQTSIRDVKLMLLEKIYPSYPQLETLLPRVSLLRHQSKSFDAQFVDNKSLEDYFISSESTISFATNLKF